MVAVWLWTVVKERIAYRASESLALRNTFLSSGGRGM